MKKLLYVFLCFAFVVSCTTNKDIAPASNPNRVSEYSADFLREWYHLTCRIIKETPGFLPTISSRAMGYLGITVYEAAYTGIPGAKSLTGQLNRFTPGMVPEALTKNIDYHWGVVVNAAMADMMRYMFDKNLSRENLQKINDMEQKNLVGFSTELRKATAKTIIEESIKHGKAVARAVYEYSKTDGGHEAYLNPFERPFTPVAGPDKWVATDTRNLTPLSPSWPKCRPFLRSNMVYGDPERPIPFSTSRTSPFFKEAMDVYTQVTNNTADQTEIAKYWADDPFVTCTPGGHSMNIMTQLLEETKATLEKAVVAYAMFGIGQNDCFIACWKTKYDYSLLRPVTFIQRHIDPNFKTVIGTPPFPAYTSGHATEAGTSERLFVKLFTNGDGNYRLTDRSQVQWGFKPRSYTNFTQMAQECADSRKFGGIHYEMDNALGLKMGRGIGENILKAIQWPTDIK
ncbi:MAG: vanadium-dependent haloperoxidase [Runella sp.]